MNLQIKVTGTPAEVAAALRKLAEEIETNPPKDPGDEKSEPITVENADRKVCLIAEPKKTLKMPVKNTEGKPLKKKADPVKKAAMCLKRAITKASELVNALREVFPAATGAAIMVLEDLIGDAVKLAQKITRLDSLESAKGAA